jgi:transcriptional regulator with XRE-family HTH domain
MVAPSDGIEGRLVMPNAEHPEPRDWPEMLREYRQAARLTQEQLAKEANYAASYIVKWEKGDRFAASHNPVKEQEYKEAVGKIAEKLSEQMTRPEAAAFHADFLEKYRQYVREWHETHPAPAPSSQPTNPARNPSSATPPPIAPVALAPIAPAPPPRPQRLLIPLVLAAVVIVAAGTLAAVYFRNSPSAPLLSNPDELYHTVTGSNPALTDALTGHDANGWREGAIREGGCKYQGGAYHSYVLTKAVLECLPDAMPSFPSSTTFAVQVELTFVSGDGGGGLVFCYTGPYSPYYRFVVRPDGYFDLVDPATGHRTSGMASPGTRYRLTAIVRAAIVYLYIDGIFMAQGSFEPGASLGGGKAGVFSVDGPRNPTDVAFRSFSVWSSA